MSGLTTCRTSRAHSARSSAHRRGSTDALHSNFLQVFGAASAYLFAHQTNGGSMLNHVSIGVRDIARTKRFYDAVLKPLGYKPLSESEASLGYGKDAVALWISKSNVPVPPDT